MSPQALFQSLRQQPDIAVDSVLCNAMLAAHARVRDVAAVEALMADMVACGPRPCVFSYSILIDV